MAIHIIDRQLEAFREQEADGRFSGTGPSYDPIYVAKIAQAFSNLVQQTHVNGKARILLHNWNYKATAEEN
jgi:hypothetical protein